VDRCRLELAALPATRAIRFLDIAYRSKWPGANSVQTTTAANPYDHPRFYDLAFGAEWRPEVGFLIASFRKYATIRVRRVFEPACGTGRLLFRLAKASFRVSGTDLNKRAIAFCNDRLQRHGFRAAAMCEDMTEIRLPSSVDAAFNLLSSFRHLLSDTAAKAHLRQAAAALRPGSIYIVGLHFTPTGCLPSKMERWTVRRRSLQVRTKVSLVSRNSCRREERFRVTFAVQRPTGTARFENRIVLRT
jgi:SAM-dependent methyltransferase